MRRSSPGASTKEGTGAVERGQSVDRLAQQRRADAAPPEGRRDVQAVDEVTSGIVPVRADGDKAGDSAVAGGDESCLARRWRGEAAPPKGVQIIFVRAA